MAVEERPKEAEVVGGNEDHIVKEGKLFAIVAYIGILCLLPILIKKENKYALHHGKQGLVIFISFVIVGFLPIIPILGWVLSPILFIILVIFSLIGIIQAATGNYWRAPIVADLADKIKL